MLRWPWSRSLGQRHCCLRAAWARGCGAWASPRDSKPQAAGVGDPTVGTLVLWSFCTWWLVPTKGTRLREKKGTYPDILIFQTEWRGTPQTQYQGGR